MSRGTTIHAVDITVARALLHTQQRDNCGDTTGDDGMPHQPCWTNVLPPWHARWLHATAFPEYQMLHKWVSYVSVSTCLVLHRINQKQANVCGDAREKKWRFHCNGTVMSPANAQWQKTACTLFHHYNEQWQHHHVHKKTPHSLSCVTADNTYFQFNLDRTGK